MQAKLEIYFSGSAEKKSRKKIFEVLTIVLAEVELDFNKHRKGVKSKLTALPNSTSAFLKLLTSEIKELEDRNDVKISLEKYTLKKN